jgi:putative component of membrane protein insertase Oxa1/YidC/SpoIIIJ protein YidD
MTTAVAVGVIDLYQQYISPYKGFCCAHRAKHGRTSCSQFAKRLIEKVGLLRFWPLLTRRFERCGHAARAMKEQRRRDDARRRDHWAYGCTPDLRTPGGCDGGDVAAAGCDAASVAVDCGACDFMP